MVRSGGCGVVSHSVVGPQQRKPRRQVWAEEGAARKRYRLREYHSEDDHEIKEHRSESVFAIEVVVVVAKEGEGMIVGNFEELAGIDSGVTAFRWLIGHVRHLGSYPLQRNQRTSSRSISEQSSLSS